MTTHAWTPSDRDRMIYKWVKFDGHKQSWVADQLSLNQSTVSRILDRYERWIAHGGPAQQGGLNKDERLRAQLWLTYERNEWIITSSLRLAGEMEHATDTSKSTTTHHCSDPSREIAVRTENSVLDRSAKAHRYLSLAHRVGKNQIELLEKYDLPALEPFTLDPNEYSQALADARSGFQSQNTPFVEVPSNTDTPTRRASEGKLVSTSSEPGFESDHTCHSAAVEIRTRSDTPPPPLSPSPDVTVPMHAMHISEPAKTPLTSNSAVTSIEISPHKKPVAHAYASPQNPPETTDRLDPILDATTRQPLPPIRILPIYMPLNAP